MESSRLSKARCHPAAIPSANMPTGFLDLPPEVRLVIYEYTLYHYETEGIISPLPDQWYSYTLPVTRPHHRDDLKSKLRVMIGEHRYFLDGLSVKSGCCQIDSEYYERDPEDSSEVERFEKIGSLEAERERFDQSAAKRTGHDCSLDCLVQPPLTRVCRLFRCESLPVFYGKNHIHLELGNWRKPRLAQLPKRSPVDWWRAVGEMNLRLISTVSIAVSHHSKHKTLFKGTPKPYHDVLLTASRTLTQNVPTVSVHIADVGRVMETIRDPGFSEGQRKKAQSDTEREVSRIKPFASRIEEAVGLSVQVLESMASDSESENSGFGLHDYSALEPWSLTHEVPAKIDAVIKSIKDMRERLYCRAAHIGVSRPVMELLKFVLRSADYDWLRATKEEQNVQIQRAARDMKMAWSLLDEAAARKRGLDKSHYQKLLDVLVLPRDAQYEKLCMLTEACDEDAEI